MDTVVKPRYDSFGWVAKW
ncbi:MAG TPA: hypothetical protein LFV92_03260 [Rickettsia endosymbiont of Ceroptres masudai]|nr:hypothetical protein [Rickettsia endosymbiont of Ceroptres masudai]